MDVMIDVETLANSSNYAIIQIGAAVFNRKTGDIVDKFKVNVDSQSSIGKGMEMNADTIDYENNNGVANDALEDCLSQISYKVDAFNKVRV